LTPGIEVGGDLVLGVLVYSLAAAFVIALAVRGPGDTPPVAGAHVDTKRHVITIVIGPFDVPSMPAGMEHATHEETPGTMPLEFNWPANGWFRGYRTEILDGQGRPLSRQFLHHFTLLNYDRRSLFAPVAERLAGASLESEDAMAPKTIGAPMKGGQRLGLFVMWRNHTGRDYHDVYLRLTLVWSPANLLPRPVPALPIVLDVNHRPPQSNNFDVPPGRYERSTEFVFPLSGRLLAATGHLHDQGEAIRLEDVATGRVLLDLRAQRSADGAVQSVSRRMLARWGRGLKIEAGRRYRVVGIYNNVTPDTARHAMAMLVGIFAPDDMRQWQPVDYNDPMYLTDLAHYGASTTTAQGEHAQHHMP
jgi:hypothetical protein